MTKSETTAPVDKLISSLCATIPDYPKPGIVFKDLTPVFADGAALKAVVDALVEPFKGQFDAVAGVEARGFLLAAAAAYATGTGVITVRKAGKLPREVVSEDYALEYGSATLELHTTDLAPGSRVLILDDVLATGGTLAPPSGCSNAAASKWPVWVWSWNWVSWTAVLPSTGIGSVPCCGCKPPSGPGRRQGPPAPGDDPAGPAAPGCKKRSCSGAALKWL